MGLGTRKLQDNEPMPNDTLDVGNAVSFRFLSGMLIGGMVLGGVQCAAWNFNFPTSLESRLWRCSSLVTVTAFPVFYAIAILEDFMIEHCNGFNSKDIVGRVTSILTFTMFLGGRLFILFETIYSLFHLPPGAFISTWSSSIPHIA
jgi:hypothetical protein